MSKYGFGSIETEVKTAEEREFEHETLVYRRPTVREFYEEKKEQAKAWAKKHPRATKGLIIAGGILAAAKAVTCVATNAAKNAVNGMKVEVDLKGDKPSGTAKTK